MDLIALGSYRGIIAKSNQESDTNAQESTTSEGSPRGERRPESSTVRRDQRPMVSAGTVEAAIALWASRVAGATRSPTQAAATWMPRSNV